MNKKTYLTAEQIEKRFSVIRTLISVAVALVFCFIMIALSSENLANDVITFITAPVSSLSRFTTFIIKMCPIIFTSCAICLLFQSGVSNLAVEGAFYVAAVMAAAQGELDDQGTGLTGRPVHRPAVLGKGHFSPPPLPAWPGNPGRKRWSLGFPRHPL